MKGVSPRSLLRFLSQFHSMAIFCAGPFINWTSQCPSLLPPKPHCWQDHRQRWASQLLLTLTRSRATQSQPVEMTSVYPTKYGYFVWQQILIKCFRLSDQPDDQKLLSQYPTAFCSWIEELCFTVVKVTLFIWLWIYPSQKGAKKAQGRSR